ncbi:MAG: flagellin [Haliea sp.]|uniref:flagellin n=1 Tax=Haliea sp. TaxID=1932666 RepID=UPI000C3E7E06|nr:flagellin [Haliea sp.]MBM70514.1 flagellin [Haliea sp.]|tara:strand:+ start:35980 stop:37398 length:1419 start_codon:yes stop_codon:yes gene_type:complete
MPQIINTNIPSLTAQRNLNSSQNDVATSLQRLSSGLRINSAKDDAAGLAISERFTAQIRGLNQAARNANDGISLAQTAEGALAEVTNNLQRIRELSVQSANATNSASDRQALQAEVTQLVAEIDRVASQTNFNGVKLLDGTFSSQVFQVGANAGETISVDSITSARSSDLGQFQGFQLSAQAITSPSATGATTAQTVVIDGNSTSLGTIASDAKALANALNASGLGFTATANETVKAAGVSGSAPTAAGNSTVDINGLTITIAGTTDLVTNRANAVTAINAQSAVTGVTATDTGAGVELRAADGRNIDVANFAAGGATGAGLDSYGLGAAGVSAGTLDITYVAPAGTTGAVTFTGGLSASSATIGSTGTAISAVDISTVSGSNSALLAVDAALTAINGSRADLGAIQNRFESVVTSLQTTSENLDASRSRIRDADFAQETANLARAQILQQAGISVLAQANAQPQNVLALLQ